MQANAAKVQKRLTNRHQTPVQVAADVVERVLATGGEMYLETHEQHLRWWQLSMLDVKLFLASVAVCALVVVLTLVRFVGQFVIGQVCALMGISWQKLKAA